jgi:hypothetical protein
VPLDVRVDPGALRVDANALCIDPCSQGIEVSAQIATNSVDASTKVSPLCFDPRPELEDGSGQGKQGRP